VSWLKQGFRVLKSIVRLSSAFRSIRRYASGQLKKSVRAFREELAAHGLPDDVIKELAETYLRLGKSLVDFFLSGLELGRKAALYEFLS